MPGTCGGHPLVLGQLSMRLVSRKLVYFRQKLMGAAVHKLRTKGAVKQQYSWRLSLQDSPRNLVLCNL